MKRSVNTSETLQRAQPFEITMKASLDYITLHFSFFLNTDRNGRTSGKAKS